MKLLRQTIRGLLLTESLHPKIERMAQYVEARNADEDKYEHLKIVINIEDDDFIEVKLLARNGSDRVGIVEAVKYNERCLEAFEVTWAKNKIGLGPLLYDITMEIASHYGTGLMCDRSSVSDDAFSVWDKYLHRRCKIDRNGKCRSPDIEVLQLDNEKWPQTPQVEDDCRGKSSQEHYSADLDPMDGIDKDGYLEYWNNEDPLSKVYIKKDPAVIRRLLPYIKWKTGNLSTAAPGWVK
tara:strand:- start:892 stop:1605 length:714 start_codon:yes stop_codon:yes gene_type:complete